MSSAISSRKSFEIEGKNVVWERLPFSIWFRNFFITQGSLFRRLSLCTASFLYLFGREICFKRVWKHFSRSFLSRPMRIIRNFCNIRCAEMFSRSSVDSPLTYRSWSCQGITNGINSFLPDSFNSFSNFGSLSGYLESLLHLPQQHCFVPTILTMDKA